MRPRIPNRNFPTESRRTISKSHSTFNGLLRRLSNRAESSFFGGAQAQEEGQNTMSNPANGARGRLSKRRNTTSDQERDQEPGSSNNGGLSRRSTEGSQSPAEVLASSNRALQRLAGIAQYLESSFTPDIDVVEGAYGTEMEKENKIRTLNKTVETLTHIKSEEMEILRQENEELRSEQEACDQERKRCQEMKKELETQYTEAEARREEENKQTMQAEKAKLRKHVKTKKAEFEEEQEQKVRELEDQKEKLSAKNRELEQRSSAAEEKLKTKKTKHALLENALGAGNEKLTTELEQLKAEFPIEGQTIEFYSNEFRQICDSIKDISLKYFQKLPEEAMKYPDAVHSELCKSSPVFGPTPIWRTPISEFLRLRNVQHIISICLCDFIWQPFIPQGRLPNHQGVSQFLEAVSESLSATGGRSESVWRVLTLRGIDALGGPITESGQVKSTVQRVLEILRPLTTPSESADLKEGLISIASKSVTLWESARKDEARLVVVKQPDPSDENKWQAEDMCGMEELSMPPDGKIDTTGLDPLCLFPSLLHINSRGETVVLHRGSALFPTARVWIQGMLGKARHEEELAKALTEARSKVNARRISFSVGPNGPPGGKIDTKPVPDGN